jgi:antitoxin HigA-1
MRLCSTMRMTTDADAQSPHPGEFIREVYLEPFAVSVRQLAVKPAGAPSTLNRLLNGAAGVSPEMALRLPKALGRPAESWLALG